MLASLALLAMKDPRRIDLLSVLFSHDLRVSKSLLNKAAVSADPAMMRTLLENYDEEDEEVDGSKALLVAAGSNWRIIETLLDGWFDVDWKASPSPSGRDEGCEREDKKTSRGQKEHKERQEEKGGAAESRTLLHVAAAMGNLDAVKMLLKHGTRTDIKDNHGPTPEKTALENGRMEIAELLEIIHASRKK